MGRLRFLFHISLLLSFGEGLAAWIFFNQNYSKSAVITLIGCFVLFFVALGGKTVYLKSSSELKQRIIEAIETVLLVNIFFIAMWLVSIILFPEFMFVSNFS
jgi:hypothetical protein